MNQKINNSDQGNIYSDNNFAHKNHCVYDTIQICFYSSSSGLLYLGSASAILAVPTNYWPGREGTQTDGYALYAKLNMSRISPGFIVVPSIGVWLYGTIVTLETNSIVSNIFLHLSTIGYLTGIFIWGRNNRTADSPVVFWNKSNQGTDLLGCLGRMFKISAALNLFVLTLIIIASNWIPYNIYRTEHNWVNIQNDAIDQLELKSTLGDSLQFESLELSWGDSITVRSYQVIGNSGRGIIEITVNHQDSIMSLEFQSK